MNETQKNIKVELNTKNKNGWKIEDYINAYRPLPAMLAMSEPSEPRCELPSDKSIILKYSQYQSQCKSSLMYISRKKEQNV